MSHNNLLDTSTVSLSDVIGNGKVYRVPSYQRDYSWKTDHWEDLWSDILSILDNDGIHYMGSIVLQDKGQKVYSVIDGQQRLTTCTIIVLATIQVLQDLVEEGVDESNNQQRIEGLKRKFLGDKDPASLTYRAKLELNENNNGFFKTNLMVFRPPVNERTLGDSDRLLLKAYRFFLDRISEHFRDVQDGEKIANFLDKEIAEKLKFIQIIVQNEVSAYTVFETLNYRGERLTVSDLLKNFLFSISTEPDLPHIKEKWKKIIDTIGLNKFPTFLRHYWISKNKLTKEKQLFNALKESVTTSEQVIDLLDNLELNAQLYNSLTNPNDLFWSGNKTIESAISELKLFKEQQALPLLMAAYNQFDFSEFEKTLKMVNVITFRYTVIAGLHTNKKETVYNTASLAISNKIATKANDLLKILHDLYVSDVDFKNDFSTVSISTKRNKSLVRYVLFKLENNLSHKDDDFESSPATIEHILPENPSLDWEGKFPYSIQETMIYRLGNYCLLEDDKNRSCARKPFLDKLEIYKTSQYISASSIDYSEWSPKTIDRRQDEMAKRAKSIWRISQFHELSK
jgi:uncharacterized protein with ParB-like and HNH nuclease domain